MSGRDEGAMRAPKPWLGCFNLEGNQCNEGAMRVVFWGDEGPMRFHHPVIVGVCCFFGSILLKNQ